MSEGTGSARRRGARALLPALTAVLAGVATGLGQAPVGWWPLVLPGVAALTVLVAGRRARTAAGLAYLFGLGMFGTCVSWVSVLGWPVAVILVVVMAGFCALTGWAVRTVILLPGGAVWAACVWSATEVLTARWPVGGFGWVRLAWASVGTPVAGAMRWVGAVGTSLLLALAGQFLAVLVRPSVLGTSSARRRRLVAGCCVVAELGLMSAVGLWTTSRPDPTADPAHPAIRVGIIQGGVDGTAGSHAMGYARSVTDNHLSETIAEVADQRAHGRPATDMLLWPENSTDIDPTVDAPTREIIMLASRIADQPILVGAVTDGPGPDERQTTGMWWPVGADGPTGLYHKRNLVPFGEWIPWRSTLLPLLPILQQVGRQSIPGTTPGVIDATVAGHRVVLGDVVCFELAYDPTVHDTVRNGATLLTVQSNNATYTATGQPYQQWQITRARAIETGRPIVVSTTSSLSGLIEPSGRVVTRTAEATHAHRVVTVPLTSGVSLGVQLTPAITWGSTALAGLALLAGLLRGAARRRGSAR
ncbi:apolipoprotein N-acyltransferase [Acidipropionibacterium timonense]|uniref:apolipoprotein N-acyltransferase n=1 Tax=Acidipropionibacterium timonense TaxID=2161818 RepID=UPI00103115F5|nr:apolipoprotein N-acyltransferase [Acidipropionibacterium timonense]